MPVERSAGIIIFRNTPKGRKYLVLRASRSKTEIAKGKFIKEFWDFPKGRLEPGERGVDAALRESEEEAGVDDIKLIPKFKETVRYFVWKNRDRNKKATLKFVALFLAESKTDKVKLSWEHDKYEWLSFKEVEERVTLKEMKKALAAADSFLKAHE